jgi:hypothetical protein
VNLLEEVEIAESCDASDASDDAVEMFSQKRDEPGFEDKEERKRMT